MAEFEPQPTTETISGTHLEIEIVRPAELQTFLEHNKSFHTLIESTSDQLPRPLNKADLRLYNPEEIGTPLDPSGHVSFDLPAHGHTEWKNDIMNQLKARVESTSYQRMLVDDQIIQFAYEDNALYIRLSNDYYTRIEISSDIDECSIYASVETRDHIEQNLERSIDPITDMPDTTNAYDQLKQFTQVWLHTINGIADAYNTPTKPTTRYRLTITPPIKKTEKVKEPISEIEMPEIEKTIGEEKSMAFVGGLTLAKSRLQEMIDINQNPYDAARYGVTSGHFILHGPPGTGKTSLIEAFAHDLEAQIFRVKSSDIVDMYIGKSAQNTQEVFDKAIKLSEYGTVLLFFDEVDALIGKANNYRERSDVYKIMNTNLERISEEYPNRIIFAGAMNPEPSEVVESIIRSGRIETIYAGLPNPTERHDIWLTVLLKSVHKLNQQVPEMLLEDTAKEAFALYANDIDIAALVAISEGMTGADITLVLARARKYQWNRSKITGVYGSVSHEDIVREIKQFYVS